MSKISSVLKTFFYFHEASWISEKHNATSLQIDHSLLGWGLNLSRCLVALQKNWVFKGELHAIKMDICFTTGTTQNPAAVARSAFDYHKARANVSKAEYLQLKMLNVYR